MDLGLYSAYIWRGLSYSNRPVLQPDLYLAIPYGKGGFSIGGWANIELGKYDDPDDDISEGGGLAGPDLTELNWWADYTTTVGKASLTLGATGYIYPNDAGITRDFDSTELYGQLGLATMLNPSLSAYWDLVFDGLYVEAGISHDLPIARDRAVTLGAAAGFNTGQDCDPDSSGACTTDENFYDDGLTHFDFSAATSFTAGALEITPVLHFQVSVDDFTRFNSPARPDQGTKVWFGVTIAWGSWGMASE